MPSAPVSLSVTASVTASSPAGTDPLSVVGTTLTADTNTSVAVGGPGAATLVGGDGSDRLAGGLGKDQIIGGLGADVASGDAGTDVFIYTSTRDSTGAGRDVILDFQPGIDRIDLSLIDADPLLPGDQTFVFTPGGLTGAAGQVTFVDSSLLADTDGDGVPDLDIHLPNITGLSTSDLVL
jgi:serralysin